MSASGLQVFDKTLQITNIWLNDIGEEIGPDRQRCYHALSAVLHALRDHLQIEQAAHLAAELPLLIKGIYFHGWSPSNGAPRERKLKGFLNCIQSELAHLRPMGAEDACRAVMRTLNRHISAGTVGKVKQGLPEDIRKIPFISPARMPVTAKAATYKRRMIP
jgi:uncharacterized protein (DUF2267 family)